MDLIETLRSTGAVREFTDEPVGDDVVGRPAQPRKRLRRQPVESFTTVDRADGPVFDSAQQGRP